MVGYFRLGTKNILKIHQKFGITEIADLKVLIEEGELAKLPGLGGKSAEKIAKSIEWMEKFDERCKIDEATVIAESIYDNLKRIGRSTKILKLQDRYEEPKKPLEILIF